MLQQNFLTRHWARDWRALALTQVHHEKELISFRRRRAACYIPPLVLCGARPPSGAGFARRVVPLSLQEMSALFIIPPLGC